jgi:hypothetical protein
MCHSQFLMLKPAPAMGDSVRARRQAASHVHWENWKECGVLKNSATVENGTTPVLISQRLFVGQTSL